MLTLVTRRIRTYPEIRIKDNGSGVSPEFIDMTFKPIFAIWQTRRRTALPGEMVRRHADEIRVDCEPGAFTALRPREPQSEPGDDGNTDTRDNGPEHIT